MQTYFLVILEKDEPCKLESYKSLQFGYLGYPYDLTFTIRFNGFSCDETCLKYAEKCFLRNGTVADNNNNTKITNEGCSTSKNCCMYNFTLAIKNVTIEDIAIYKFLFAGHTCDCFWYKLAVVDFKAESWYLQI